MSSPTISFAYSGFRARWLEILVFFSMPTASSNRETDLAGKNEI